MEITDEMKAALVADGWIPPIPDSPQYAINLGDTVSFLSESRDDITRGFMITEHSDGSVSTIDIGPINWIDKLGFLAAVQARLHARFSHSIFDEER